MVGRQLWLQLQPQPFKIRTFLSGFQMIFDKMAAISPDFFKWLGFQISDPVPNPDYLMVGFQRVLFSNGQALAMAIAIVPTIQKPDHANFLSEYQMVGLLDFRTHSKSRPFAIQPLLDHSKYRLVLISDCHCMFHNQPSPLFG